MIDDSALVAKAKTGDRPAFDQLANAALPKMRAVIWRMVGHPEDCQDLMQDAILKSWKGLQGFDGRSSFSTWATAIAARTAIDYLRDSVRWRRESQIAFANLCAESEILQGEIMAPMMEPEFTFDVKEHIAYCLVCVGRSLPPEEQAVLVLREVMEFSAREAAEALGISDSVLRHRLSAARSEMEKRYDGLCALVSKTGICHQCEGLAAAANAVGGRSTLLPSIETLAERMAIAKGVNPDQRKTEKLHSVFFRRCKSIEDKGEGAIYPQQCD